MSRLSPKPAPKAALIFISLCLCGELRINHAIFYHLSLLFRRNRRFEQIKIRRFDFMELLVNSSPGSIGGASALS